MSSVVSPQLNNLIAAEWVQVFDKSTIMEETVRPMQIAYCCGSNVVGGISYHERYHKLRDLPKVPTQWNDPKTITFHYNKGFPPLDAGRKWVCLPDRGEDFFITWEDV